MVRQVINKIISLVLVSSLLIGNICTYVEARDFKLSFIYMLDAIEDMEYKERESVYESEHLSFLSKDESNNESSTLESTTIIETDESENENEEETTNSNEYEEEPEDDTESESQESTTNTDESENTDTSVEEEQESNKATFLNNSDKTIVNEEINTIATNSDVSEEDNNNSGNNEEPEDDIIEPESTMTSSAEETTSEIQISEETITKSETSNVATNSNIVDTEENESKSTPSEVEEVIVKEEVEDIVVATESEIYDVEIASLSEITSISSLNEGLFGSGGGQELFTFPVSSSDFTLRAVTKKSRRGGQTCLGVIVCGIMQTPFHTNPNSFLQSECTHEDRHVVELNVYKEDEEGNDVFVSTQTCSPGSIAYPNYTSFGSTFTESKVYNMQSGLFSINTPLRLNTIYNITEKISKKLKNNI